MNAQWLVASAIVAVIWQSAPVLGQEAILPQGDPRLREEGDEQHRAEARDRRLKQQGQGKDYRVEGKPQDGKPSATDGRPNGSGRQDTGIDDPTVNPGQAAGMRVVRGEVKQATLKSIVVEDANGKQTTMTIDAATAGDRDIKPGDVLTGTVTAQGRAIALHKERAVEAKENDPSRDR